MAKQPMMPNNHNDFVLLSPEGQELLRIGSQEFMVIDNSGNLNIYKNNQAILLADGSAWSPQMLQTNPPVFLSRCDLCAKKRLRHFKQKSPFALIPAHRGKICVDCGKTCCPAHRHLIDDSWRCLPCDKKYRYKRRLKSLFFKKDI